MAMGHLKASGDLARMGTVLMGIESVILKEE